MTGKINLAEKFALFEETWTPKIVGGVDDYDIKIAKIDGEFVWHNHPDADELFLVVAGRMRLMIKGADDVILGPGEIYVVPRGVEHMPVAETETQIVMIERKGTVNTGTAGGERTVEEPERI